MPGKEAVAVPYQCKKGDHYFWAAAVNSCRRKAHVCGCPLRLLFLGVQACTLQRQLHSCCCEKRRQFRSSKINFASTEFPSVSVATNFFANFGCKNDQLSRIQYYFLPVIVLTLVLFSLRLQPFVYSFAPAVNMYC